MSASSNVLGWTAPALVVLATSSGIHNSTSGYLTDGGSFPTNATFAS